MYMKLKIINQNKKYVYSHTHEPLHKYEHEYHTAESKVKVNFCKAAYLHFNLLLSLIKFVCFVFSSTISSITYKLSSHLIFFISLYIPLTSPVNDVLMKLLISMWAIWHSFTTPYVIRTQSSCQRHRQHIISSPSHPF